MSELQIKEGRYYRLRNGEVAGPAKPTGDATYAWEMRLESVDDNVSVTNSGCFWGDGEMHRRDAVAEVTANGKGIAHHSVIVGQRWRYVGNASAYYTPHSTYAVLSTDGDRLNLEDKDGANSNSGRGHILYLDDDFFRNFELVKDEPKVADRAASSNQVGVHLDNNPKTAFGVQKPPLHAIPPSALIHLGLAMENGEGKYGLFNWRSKRVSSSVYYDAALRHLMSWWDGEEVAADSIVHHLGHVMACCAILVDAIETGNLNDDRGTPGGVSSIIERIRSERAARKNPEAQNV